MVLYEHFIEENRTAKSSFFSLTCKTCSFFSFFCDLNIFLPELSDGIKLITSAMHFT